MVEAGARRAQVVGLGLIGGSLGLALRARGWVVTGDDEEVARAAEARRRGVVDHCGVDPAPEVTFVATPAGAVAPVARRALAGPGVVTDVAGVKAPVVEALDDPRFVGGHPMAGSEQVGLDGADADLFVGATWVLTPGDSTDPEAYATVAAVVASLGANPVALPAGRHDELVAVVSHVPHLAAATLMNLATDASLEHGALLRLAAGGFRDMTRIAAGHPGIWPDVVMSNRAVIVRVLDELIGELAGVRKVVDDGDRDGLLERLHRAQEGRVNLPSGAPDVERSAEVRVPVPDRPGVLAEVLTTAGDLGVNVSDIEIAHSAEGERGVLVLVVDESDVEGLRRALGELGYKTSSTRLGQ